MSGFIDRANRIAVPVLAVVALAGGGVAAAAPQAVGPAGLALLIGLAAAGAGLLAALSERPARARLGGIDALSQAERSDIPTAATEPGGALIFANRAYRAFARAAGHGVAAGDPTPPPASVLAAHAPDGAVLRLVRAARGGPATAELGTGGGRLSVRLAPLSDAGGAMVWTIEPSREAAPGPGPGPGEGGAEPHGAGPMATTHDPFAGAPVGLAALAPGGTIEAANAAFAALTGGAPLGRTPLQLFAEDAASLAAAVEGAGAAGPFEVALPGEDRVGALHVGARAADGRRVLALVDQTEERKRVIHGAQAQKLQAIGHLAGGIAHDFNNLLTAIMGHCDFLKLNHPMGDPSFQEAESIRQNAARGARMVRQLLAFSRKQTLTPRLLDMREVVSEQANLLRRLIGEKVRLDTDFAADLWTVRADDGQIGQVLMNFAVNARDAMQEGGALSISLANLTLGSQGLREGAVVVPAGDYVRMTVTDTGPGIPAEHLPKVFDPFFTTKAVGEGTGLGLSMVYGIVKQTGGFVFADNAPGAGARFRIYLPRHVPGEGEGEAAAAAAKRRLRGLSGDARILLVEDDRPVRAVVVRQLRAKGYKVIETACGEDALEALETDTGGIDLLLTDVVMPGMDGPELVERVRGLVPDLPVVMMSGYAEDALAGREDRLADVIFLPKPFDIEKLAETLKDALAGTQ